jgi:hypothetical protein
MLLKINKIKTNGLNNRNKMKITSKKLSKNRKNYSLILN